MESIEEFFVIYSTDAPLLKLTKTQLFKTNTDKQYCCNIIYICNLKPILSNVLDNGYYIPQYQINQKCRLTLASIEEIALEYRMKMPNKILRNKALYDDDPIIRVGATLIGIVLDTFDRSYTYV